MYTFLSQPPNFTLSLLTETGFSTNFSSGKGSHLLLDRLLGLFMYFGNEATWVKDCELLYPRKMSQICISGIRTSLYHIIHPNNRKVVNRPQITGIKPTRMKRERHIIISYRQRENRYSLLAKSGSGKGKRGSVSQSRVWSVPSAVALVII